MLRSTISAGSSPFIPWGAGGPTAATVSLIAGAAGPIGGDRLRLEVEVGPGSTLVLREVASTVLLTGLRGEESLTEVDVRVADGATFVWLPEPVIAARGCRHRTDIRLALEPTATRLPTTTMAKAVALCPPEAIDAGSSTRSTRGGSDHAPTGDVSRTYCCRAAGHAHPPGRATATLPLLRGPDAGRHTPRGWVRAGQHLTYRTVQPSVERVGQ
jgi:hypothetical protein